MNLFIFEPHTKWGYCGGAIVVVADHFEEAIDLIKLIKENWSYPDQEFEFMFKRHNFYSSVEDFNNLIKPPVSDIAYIHAWILTHQFKISDDTPKGVIVNNWNYS